MPIASLRPLPLQQSGQAVALGPAGESDGAFALTRIKSKAIALTNETNAGFPASARRLHAAGLAIESEQAFAFSFDQGGSRIVAIGQAIDSENAFTLAANRSHPIGVATEADAAQAIVAGRLLGIGESEEVDLADALARLKHSAIGVAPEADTASAVWRSKRRAIALVLESDVAAELAALTTGHIGFALEFDQAFAASHRKTGVVGTADEVDFAFGFGIELPVHGWPLDVPQAALIDGYGEEAEDNAAEFVPEVGPPMLRRRFSQASPVLVFATVMSGAQYARLLEFYRVTLRQGTTPFNRQHPRTGVARRFYFLGPPRAQATQAVDRYRVDMQVR